MENKTERIIDVIYNKIGEYAGDMIIFDHYIRASDPSSAEFDRNTRLYNTACDKKNCLEELLDDIEKIVGGNHD